MQQADCAHSATVTAASLGNSTNFSTSRRGALGILATLPLLAAAGPAVGQTAADTAEWDAAMSDLIEAKEILARTAPAYAAARAAMEATEPDSTKVDWQGLEGTTARPEQVRHLDTAKCRSDTLRHIEAGYWRHDPERPRRRLAALDQLDAYRAAVAENQRRHAPTYRPALEADEAAVYRVDLCEVRLMETPAPHGRALLWKIDHLVHGEGDGTTPSWSIDYVEPMLADARRLLGASM